MNRIRKIFCGLLALVMVVTIFNLNSMESEAVSKNSKIYKIAMKERKKFKKEAEYYGYVFTKDKKYSLKDKKIIWWFEVWNCDPDSDFTFNVDVYQITKKELYYSNWKPRYYETSYAFSTDPNYHSDDRDSVIRFLKKHSLASSIREMLVRKSTKSAKKLKKSIEGNASVLTEITSEYVKKDKTGRASFAAVNSKGTEYKISVRYHRGKKRGQIIAKYYLNGKASSRSKIIDKF